MRTRFVSMVLFLTALLWADVGWAREWLVERLSGTAWTVQSVEARTELKVGMSVAEGVTIATSRNGRVRLSSDNNVMTLGPGSLAAVRPRSRFSSKTEVLQKVGSIEFDIEKRGRPHFSVQTPFMAAVVKGTVFTISVTKTDTRIGVGRGLVQVQDLRSGQTAGVGAGQEANVSSQTAGLKTAGPDAPTVAPGRPSAPSVSPVGQTLGSFRSNQAAVRAQTSAAAASRSFGFGLGAAPSTNGPSGSRAGVTSSFGGFGGGFNSEGGDRDAGEKVGAVGTSREANNDGPGGPNDSGAAAGSPSQGSDGPSPGSGSDQGPNGGGLSDNGSNGGGNGTNGGGNSGGPNGGGSNRDGNNGNGNGNGGGNGSNGGGNGQGNNGNGDDDGDDDDGGDDDGGDDD